MVLSRYVGARVRRKEDPRLITGSSTYVDDLHLPGMLHVAVVRGPYAHARINGIDASDALAIPGVVAVYTADDLNRIFKQTPDTAGASETGEQASEEVAADEGIPVPDVPPLAVGKVRYVGEGIAAVVATSAAVARDAAEAVQVDFEPLDAVTDPYAAMEEGAPILYDEVKNNISVREETVHGDVDAALADAAIRLSARIRANRVFPLPIEPRGCVAAPDPITRGTTMWSSTQAPHWNRKDIARALGLSESQVRFIAPEVGGAFGCKIGVYPEEFVVAAIAFDQTKPVKWIETRSENLLATNHGRNQWADFEVAAAANGKITGLRARIVLDSGAYPKALDLAWATWVMATGPYDIPNLDYRVTGVYTNTMANGAYRGAGRPEAAYYLERLVDLIADEGGLDPADVRRVNFITPDKFPYTTLSGEHYDSGEYEKTLDKALDAAGYARLRQEQASARQEGRYLGVGIASYVEICGFGPYDSAKVRVEPTGAVSIFTGISPHGQGQETTFAQLTADHLGADFESIVVHHGDTASNPMGNGTMGSRGLVVGGSALMLSLKKLNEKSKRIAAHLLEAALDDVELAEGTYRVKGVPTRGLSLAEIADKAYSGDLPDDIDVGLETTDFFKPADETFPFGTHVAVVEIFPETGEIKITKYVSVDDCGVIISPMLVEGQVHGGLAQGIGQALFEEVIYDTSGELLTGTLNDYAVPKAANFPAFETHHTETKTHLNPLGAKGIGEAATIGSTPAIANAVIDALSAFGITHLDMPFTAEKVWRAINEARGQPASAVD
ncbi:MAG: xanthine dehydrogenase family protein molybdopterin-binding subunit [Thermomicrobiales bacterium]